MSLVFKYIVDNNAYYLDNPNSGEISRWKSPELSVRREGVEYSGLHMERDQRDMNSHENDSRPDPEQKIREYQKILERYELASAGSTAVIWDWDISSDKLFLPDRTSELMGYPREELPDSMEEFRSLIHRDDLQNVRLAAERHFTEHVPYLVDMRLKTGSGDYRWFHSRGQASRDDNGNAVRMAGSLADVTDRKTADLLLEKTEKQYRLLVEQSPLPISIWTPEGQLILYNNAWLKMWNIHEKEVTLFKENYNLLKDQQLRELGVLPLVERAFSGEEVIVPPFFYRGEQTADDIDVDLADPNNKWIQLHFHSLRDEKGKVLNVVSMNSDLTDLKQAEQEAREHREALARIDRASVMGQLTGSISHELNQPLTGVLSNAQAAELLLAREDLDRDELTDIISAIISDTKRAGEVIRNLRDVYREQKGDFKPVDIDKVVAETIELMHSEFIVQDVELSLKTASSLPQVRGNKIQIQQVLVNILMNGVQATSDLERTEHKLNIETVRDGNEVRVLVEDRGPGIDNDKIDRIFEPLVTWKPGGTGMGLAISNTIIKAHGGRMFAENRPEGGARVGFAIPAIKEK